MVKTKKRRGKKIRLGDVVSIPEDGITIDIITPTDEEKKEHLEALAEKARVAAIVKELNAKNKKDKKQNQAKKQAKPTKEHKRVRFPGT